MASKPKLDLNAVLQQADDFVMALCAPEKMEPWQAKDFLGRVIDRCSAAIEALEEENNLDA